MRHMQCSGTDIDSLKDGEFHQFRSSLDSEMKRLQSCGAGSQAEVIFEDEEVILWKEGLLGNSSPQILLNSMVFYCGLCFALCSGKEYWQLRHSPCQIELVETSEQRLYIRYTEDI